MGLTSRDVMEKALEDLVLWVYANAQWGCTPMEVIYAQAALANPELDPEPVAWMMENINHPHLAPILAFKPFDGWHKTWTAVPLYRKGGL